MMFYRRKIILSLLQLFGGKVDKVRLQHLLFLFSRLQEKPDYDFVPCCSGCCSYSAAADIAALAGKGLLGEDEKGCCKVDKSDYLHQLKPDDLRLLLEVKEDYGKMNAPALEQHIYQHDPFYAGGNKAVASVLTEEAWDKIKKTGLKENKIVLFTLGYEGVSLEAYLVRLLKNDVKVLVDVRSNPFSRKYGFSKNQLKKYGESSGIAYVHIPEVGIPSGQRQELNTPGDYGRLFEAYRKNMLPHTTAHQVHILSLLKEHKRIALTCFEADACQCHRKYLAEAIEKLSGFACEVKHI
jgi:hypothetical protein